MTISLAAEPAIGYLLASLRILTWLYLVPPYNGRSMPSAAKVVLSVGLSIGIAPSVIEAGVRTVAGGVVGDAGRYDDEYYAPSWDASARVSEAGPYDALLVNERWAEAIASLPNTITLGGAATGESWMMVVSFIGSSA